MSGALNGLMATLRQQPWLVTLVALVVLVAINVSLQPNLLTPRVLQLNLTTFLPLILVAIGQTYVILAGDIDLSVGSITALVNVTTVSVIAALGGDGTAVLAGLAAGVLVGLACGAFNGICAALLRLQPIVTTFATGIVFAGLALWVLPRAGLPVPPVYWQVYGGMLLGVPVVLWILIVAVLFVLALGRRPFQIHLAAVGGRRQAAFQTGLPVARIRIKAYMLAGLFAALAGLCLTGETASGDPLLGGSLALSSISAVVLGGTALAGGFGGPIGSILGALVIQIIPNVIFFAGVSFQYQSVVRGLIILAALAGGVLLARRS